MLNIALCDDVNEELSHLENLLTDYMQKRDLDVHISCFSNGFLFLDAISQENTFDICFLDIFMPALTGIDVAKELRKIDKETQLVFTTSTPEFALEGYKVQASNYLIKPISTSDLYLALDEILLKINPKEEDCVCLSTADGIVRIAFSKISSVLANKSNSTIILLNNQKIQTTMSFGEICSLLLVKRNFHLISRSILVNFNFVTGTKGGFLLMLTGEEIAIPRRKKAEITSAFLEYTQFP